jgi:hypothetical protein
MEDKMVSNHKGLVKQATLSYDEMQELAGSADVQIRRELAQRQDLRPEVLYFLAEDSDMEVRRQIALNPTTPRQADLLLAKDSELGVRVDLTEKIAHLAPDTNADIRDKIQTMTYDALMVLSRDQAVKVRQILSETLKDVADAPPELIKKLARDMELVVCGPVLQFSPVLSDDDLLEIISSSHAKGALNAISKRTRVSEAVSEAVIAQNEESAIADLLGNESAQIREDTLDLLAQRAEHVISWHGPLVKRPKLSARVAKRMAHYLADHLLKTLEDRRDLPEDVIGHIKEVVKKRLDETSEEDEENTDPLDDIQKMHDAGELDEDRVIDWMDENQWLHVQSALAVLSGLRRVVVKKIIASQSGKGMMALCWKAGISANLGESLQVKLAKIPVRDLLKATKDGKFPLTDEELEWHLELFGDTK